jgi:hypothetical protein
MIGARLKSVMFTIAPVARAVDRTARRVMMRIGSFVRVTAKRSIRDRKKIAPAGSPPSSHSKVLKNNILFAYEPAGMNVVIGPRALPGKAGDLSHLEAEGGGTTTLVRHGKRVRATYGGNPFMKPALKAEAPKLPQLWREQLN